MYRVRKYNIEDTHCFFIALFKYFYVSQPPLQLQKNNFISSQTKATSNGISFGQNENLNILFI